VVADMNEPKLKSMNKKIVFLLTIAAVFFLGIMYIAREKEPEYKQNLEESLLDAVKQEQVVTAAGLEKIKAEKANTPFVFIDVRTPYDFVRGHLDQAVNIPYNNMLSEENRGIFDKLKKENVVVILYGNDQSQANAPAMLLRQLGYSNVRILAGGYTAITAPADSLGNKNIIPAETASLDYAAEMKKKSVPENTTEPTAKAVEKPQPKAKVITAPQPKKEAEGGC
jgi:rhodanese-related sulfurtransferase